MARHRNIRNAKSYDYDDDYDVYGQSYEDDYCVSPATMAQYSYARNNIQFSSYMPSEEVVEEVSEEGSCIDTCEIQPDCSFSSPPCPSSETICACIEAIHSIVGECYLENQIKEAAIKFNGDVDRAANYLLNSCTDNPKDLSEGELPKKEGNLEQHSSVCLTNSTAIPMPQRSHTRNRRSRRYLVS